jgi:hypothetical protein
MKRTTAEGWSWDAVEVALERHPLLEREIIRAALADAVGDLRIGTAAALDDAHLLHAPRADLFHGPSLE